MNKLVALLAVGVLTLTGCTATTPAPAVTETVTVQPDDNGGSSSTSVRDDFKMYLAVGGVPQYMIDDPGIVDALIGQAQSVCSHIDAGQSKEEITWALTTAASSESDQDVVTAFLAASVAATYTYCPEYEGFFE